MDFRTTFNQAVAHHRAGRFAEAEQLYRTIINIPPLDPKDANSFAEAIQNLGLVCAATNRLDEGLALIERAISLEPRNLALRKNLAVTLINGNRPGDREAAYLAAKRALELDPGDAMSLHMFAHAAMTAGHKAEATPIWQKLVLLIPNDPNIRFYAALGYQEALQDDAAIAHYREAIKLRPNFVEAISNLAVLLSDRGRAKEALAVLDQADKNKSLIPSMQPLFGAMLIEAGQVAKGYAILEASRDLPSEQGLDFARQVGSALSSIGDIRQAIELLDRSTAKFPENDRLFSALVSRLQYLYPDDPIAMCARSREYDTRFGLKVPVLRPAPMTPLAGRKLKIGYLSADLRVHSVSTFLEPLVDHHDPSRVEVHCFSNSKAFDDVSRRLKARSTSWHVVETMNDDELAGLIRQTGVDALIDLNGHTAGERLLAVARKPAPLQMSYLGHSSTTGLSSIDGYITDAVADPPGMTEAHFVERLYRLPTMFAVFRPPQGAPPISPPPFERNGYVTIGSMVTLIQKVNDGVLDAWCEALRQLPTARFYMIGKLREEPFIQKRFLDRFAARGVGPERIRFAGQLPFADFLAEHKELDLLVDTFPFNGHTITGQNLWMGVPVVTCAANVHRGRMGASMLSAAGMTDLIANGPAEFAPLIVRWASDPAALAERRRTMRERMLASPLMNEKQFARDFEDLLIKAYEEKRQSTQP